MNRGLLTTLVCGLVLFATGASSTPDATSEPSPQTASDVLGLSDTVRQTEMLLFGEKLSDHIPMNKPVQAALDDWLTWMRPMLLDAYENYAWLSQDIAPVYRDAGFPEPLLFAMIATETGGKVHSRSRAGAAGLLQFMSYTGRMYGLKKVDGFDLRYDPVAATKANVAYLQQRFTELNNNLEKSLAAYNGGEGRMKKLQRRHPKNSFWDSEIYWSLPTETRDYVPRIFAAALIFMHPEAFGVEFPKILPQRAALVVQRDASLSELSICLGQQGNRNGWFRAIRNLNPKIEPEDKIEAGETLTVPSPVVDIYRANCVEDSPLLTRAHEFWAANYPEEPEMIRYTVRRGDTLSRIASRHKCCSVRELAALNGLRAPRYVIQIGQRLKVPGCG